MGDRSFQMERAHRTRDQNKFRTQKTEGRLENKSIPPQRRWPSGGTPSKNLKFFPTWNFRARQKYQSRMKLFSKI